jgi:pimeloyl-ACP methyl ester carboxylesterase
LSEAQAHFVARAWSEPDGTRVRLLGDARHRWVNPIRYSREDAEACWREIKAPILMVIGEESQFQATLGADGSDDAFRANMPQVQIAHIPGAGHMLHIEQADRVAALIEDFLKNH